MPRIVVRDGSKESNIPNVFSVALEECKRLKTNKLAIITEATDHLSGFDFGGIITRDDAKRLERDKEIKIKNFGIFLLHYTINTAQKNTMPRVGLAYSVSCESLNTLNSLPFDCLIFTPHMENECRAWAEKWNAEYMENYSPTTRTHPSAANSGTVE